MLFYSFRLCPIFCPYFFLFQINIYDLVLLYHYKGAGQNVFVFFENSRMFCPWNFAYIFWIWIFRQYAEVVIAFTQFIKCAVFFIAPVLMGLFVSDRAIQEQWRWIFWIIAMSLILVSSFIQHKLLFGFRRIRLSFSLQPKSRGLSLTSLRQFRLIGKSQRQLRKS